MGWVTHQHPLPAVSSQERWGRASIGRRSGSTEASTLPGAQGSQGQPWVPTPPAQLCSEPTRSCWQEEELDGTQAWQHSPTTSPWLSAPHPAAPAPHTCLSQGGCFTQEPPLLVLTPLSDGSGIPEEHVAFPAMEGMSQHWKGGSSTGRDVPALEFPALEMSQQWNSQHWKGCPITGRDV